MLKSRTSLLTWIVGARTSRGAGVWKVPAESRGRASGGIKPPTVIAALAIFNAFPGPAPIATALSQ